jgi:hypothetical protein
MRAKGESTHRHDAPILRQGAMRCGLAKPLARFSGWPNSPGPFPTERCGHQDRPAGCAYHFFNRVAQCAVPIGSDGLQHFQTDYEKK